MAVPVITAPPAPTAVLVGLISAHQTQSDVCEYLAELAFLAETAGISAGRRFIQRLPRPHIATYVGTGKAAEIAAFAASEGVSMVIFDDELSPSQLRNLEKILAVPVLDRTGLILKIFAQRARTAYAKMQVELAHCQYMLPRLKRMWTHLERQRGGTGARGGAGELQMESDRRIILSRIALLKEQLKKVDRQMRIHRTGRGDMVRISLVGYTNVGKSTIMNLLSKSRVFAEDELFATLDTTVRKVVIDDAPFLLADTVGFIRKLPTQLVEAFKSTLDEVREADLLLHVVDISHSRFEEQIEVVRQTLADIGAGDKSVCLVFNKTDAYPYTAKSPDDLTPRTKINIPLSEFIDDRRQSDSSCIFISARHKTNLDTLRSRIYSAVVRTQQGMYPYGEGQAIIAV